MGAETIGGHMVRSLKAMIDGLADAEKKGKDAVDKEGDKTLAELDRLIAFVRGEAPEK